MEPSVRRIHLPDPKAQTKQPQAQAPGWVKIASWLIGPALFSVVIGSVVLIRNGPDEFFTAVIGLVFVTPIVWGAVSLLFPAYPDRRCHECNELALESIADDALYGLHCTACGYVDDTATAWKFAEERDAPLEPLVMKSRQQR